MRKLIAGGIAALVVGLVLAWSQPQALAWLAQVPAAATSNCCTFVVEKYAEDISGSATLTTLAAPSMNVTGGNLLVVFCRTSQTATTVTVSDTASPPNTFTSITTASYGAANDKLSAFYAKNVTGNATDVVSCNYSPGVKFVATDVLQYSGASISAPLDQTSTGSSDVGGAAASGATGNVTTTVAKETLVAGVNIGVGGSAYTAGTNYTLRSTNPSTDASEDDIVTTIQTNVNATIAWNTGPQQWCMILATFK